MHLSTGNYNAATSKLYTDFRTLYRKSEFCKDASNLFNYLTGYSKHSSYKNFLLRL
ncbi:MAG: hypothetical protein IPP52_15600 [Ignavibacteria bacterium]|nr:hypothetical protein [Ignavibacteria bacterium]